MPRTKKTPAKRKYVKKAAKVFHAGPELLDSTFCATHENRTQEKALVDEITFLELSVQGIEQLTSDQKSRYMNYIYSRYNQYITLSKLTQ